MKPSNPFISHQSPPEHNVKYGKEIKKGIKK
jgi:hypothetical protein